MQAFRFSISRRDLLTGAALIAAVLLAYFPALHGRLVWDDDGHVTKPELQTLHGLFRIWFEVGATQQFYPLLHTAFWIEHKLWGDAVLGYHLTNVLLHAIAAFLIVAIMRRLLLPGAWLAAFLFALHPVCVEAVAWISEQKSTLSGVFYLASALLYLRFDATRKTMHYVLALALFVCALLSKTVTATLPGALLVCLWWQRGRLDWKRDVLPLLPWFGLGATAGLFTAWVEHKFIGANGSDFDLTFLERVLLAGRIVFFYAAKAIWPANLIFNYPRWTVDTHSWWQYLFPLAAISVLAIFLSLARRHHGPLAAALLFIGTLLPVLGFLNVYPFLYSYVADHFEYLAILAILIPLASTLTRYLTPRTLSAVACVTVCLLGALAYAQSRTYGDSETLYRATLARNPDSWLAHNNLGNALVKQNRLDEAISHLQAALKIKPNRAEILNNLGSALSSAGRLDEAIAAYRAALELHPEFALAHNNLAAALARIPGRNEDALAELRAAVEYNPNYAEAHAKLGLALSQMPGREEEAASELEAAVREQPDSAEAHTNLGVTLSKLPGRLPQAIAEYQAALRIAPSSAEAHNDLGSAILNGGGPIGEAISHFQAALQSRPDYAEAHMNLGAALSQDPGRLPEALHHLEQAVQLSPGSAQAHYNFGMVLMQTGQLSDAIQQFNTALRIFPNYAEAHLNLGLSLARIPGKLNEALNHLDAGLKIKPDPEAQEIVNELRAAAR